ncbi:MAG TPA: hypothetical protein VGL86_33810 [Polyangia bacterium]|jgi:hypothetical protein
MTTADVTISCPHCRRQYAMKIDPERLQRLKTRATCGRCGKTFDAASRILAAQQQAPVAEPKARPAAALAAAGVSETRRTDPKLPATTAKKTSGVTAPDLRDEMEELAREFAEAAARFTPVGIKRSTVGIGSGMGGGVVALGEAPATTKPANVEEPTNPGVVHASVAAATAGTVAPAAPASSAADDVAQLSLDAEPASDEEFAAAIPTLSRAPAAPRSWLELSDPGLAALQSPPSAGAAALEALLNDGESIALPPPPTAS